MDIASRVRSANTGCLEWIGARNHRGYGYIKIKGKMKSVHRFVMETNIGRILGKNEIVRHSCDNPPCCNLEHLSIGTAQDNMNDKVLRNRQSRGENHGMAIVTKRDVNVIRSLKGWFLQRELASIYDIGQQAISDIQNHRRWN